MTKKTDGIRTHRAHPVSRSELARRAGRSPAAVTIACRAGGALHAARLRDGRVDAAAPATVKWATKGGVDPSALLDPIPESAPALPSAARRGRGRPTASAAAAKVAAEAAAPDYGEPPNVSDLLDLPLRTILSQHQSLQGFGDWLDKRKKIADIARTEFNTARARNLFVSRVFIEQHVFGLIESTNLRLLRDMPITASSQLYSLTKSGASLEECRRVLTDIVSQNLSHVKNKTISLLRCPKSEPAPAEVPRRAKPKPKDPR